MGMGTGKSMEALALLAAWKAHRVLVLCPPSVRGVWRREIAKHYPQMTAVILDRGSVKQRTELAAKAICRTRKQGALAIVVNYETAARSCD